MKIGFIGAGRVGTAFGIYLKNSGLEISGYYSRSFESALKASELVKTEAALDMPQVAESSNIIFITTNDSEIAKVCNELADREMLLPGTIVAHMSGALSSRVLKSAREKGCYICSVHPLQAFADIDKAAAELKDTVFGIEGDEKSIRIIEALLNKTGNEYFKLTVEQKSIYHAAACVASNYLVTLEDYALSLLEAVGVDKRKAFKALYPLIMGTIKNMDEFGTRKALTGPIERGDAGTIQRHIAALEKHMPDSLELYRFMGEKTVDFVEESNNTNKDKLNAIRNLLREVQQ